MPEYREQQSAYYILDWCAKFRVVWILLSEIKTRKWLEQLYTNYI